MVAPRREAARRHEPRPNWKAARRRPPSRMRDQLTRKEKVLQVVVVAVGIVIVFLLVAIWLGTQIGD